MRRSAPFLSVTGSRLLIASFVSNHYDAIAATILTSPKVLDNSICPQSVLNAIPDKKTVTGKK